VKYLQRGAGTAFTLTLATLVLFWTVKDSRPSGHAVLCILYGVLGASAIAWAAIEVTKGLRQRSSRAASTVNAPLAAWNAASDELTAALRALDLEPPWDLPHRAKLSPPENVDALARQWYFGGLRQPFLDAIDLTPAAHLRMPKDDIRYMFQQPKTAREMWEMIEEAGKVIEALERADEAH
jgi:hypothetical protein